MTNHPHRSRTEQSIRRAAVRVRLAAGEGYDAFVAAKGDWALAVAAHPQMVALVAALQVLLSREPGRVYVRWSRSERLDRRRGYSLDHQSGHRHAGLSAVRIEPEWFTDPAYLIRRLTEYRSPGNPRGWIMVGDCVGTDSDGYDAVQPTADRWIALPRLLNA